MIRTLVDHVGHALAYVLVLGLGVLAMQVLRYARLRTKNTLVQNLLDFGLSVARNTTLALAASVRDAKDPAKPGAWTEDTAKDTAQRATNAVLALAGAQLVEYIRLSGAKAEPAQVARQLVEVAVEEQRRHAPLVAHEVSTAVTNIVTDPGERVTTVPDAAVPKTIPPATLVTLAVLALLGLGGCEAPSQHDPARWGTIEVLVAEDFTPNDTRLVRQSLVNFSSLGPSFVEARSPAAARVVVAPFSSNNCFADVLHWSPATATVSPRVEVDPTCAGSDEEFRQAVQHGLGHVLRLGHVCTSVNELPDCSPAGYGSAVMGLHLREVRPGVRRAHVYTGVASQDRITVADLFEFNRLYAPDGGTIRP